MSEGGLTTGGVAKFYELMEKDLPVTGFGLQKTLNAEIASGKFQWLYDVNSMVRQEAFKDIERSIQDYAKARHEAKRCPAETDVEKHKPRFQKKGKCQNSCRYSSKGNPWKYKSKHTFSLTRVRGLKPFIIRTCESIEFLQDARICCSTFSREGKFYYVAITYEKTNRKQTAKQGKIGLDLGIDHPVAAFDGSKDFIFDLPESLNKAEKNRDRCLRAFSRTQKGSKRHKKLQLRLQQAYVRENNIKKDYREKLTNWLTLNFNEIRVDDFGFKRSYESEVYAPCTLSCRDLCFQNCFNLEGS